MTMNAFVLCVLSTSLVLVEDCHARHGDGNHGDGNSELDECLGTLNDATKLCSIQMIHTSDI